MALCPELPGVSQYQKGKTNLDFTEPKTVSGNGISWAIYKSATGSRQITTPAPHHFLQARCPSCLPSQQHQSTEGKSPLLTILQKPYKIKYSSETQ